MLTISAPRDFAAHTASLRANGRTLGLVPTMGAIHEGHLCLVDAARGTCETVIATLFVNPLQFGRGEDLERYPRPFERDRELFRERGVDVLFAPPRDSMYASGFQTTVEPGLLAEPLCGAVRPGHFRGVTTIVAKLFHLASAQYAFFGQKDFQQVRVIERMVQDLDFDVRVFIVPTVREANGLAMSSRNQYLGAEDRQRAPALHAALLEVERVYCGGERDPRELRRCGQEFLAREPGLRVEYFEVLDDETLESPARLAERGVAAGAVRLGATRLIDNLLLGGARSRLFPSTTEAARR